MNLKLRTVAALAISFLTTASAFAGPEADKALTRLQNVMNNSIPIENRTGIVDRIITVQKDLERLEISMKKLEKYNDSFVPPQYREQLAPKIAAWKQAIGADFGAGAAPVVVIPQPEPVGGQYCTAACKDFSGGPTLEYTVGAMGSNILVAQQAAIDLLKKTYTCSLGVVEAGCEVASPNPKKWTCQSGCKDFSGLVSNQYTGIGQASTKLEAIVNAKKAVTSKYSCSLGIVTGTCISE